MCGPYNSMLQVCLVTFIANICCAFLPFSLFAQCNRWNYTFNTAQLRTTRCTVRFFAQCASYAHTRWPFKWLSMRLRFLLKVLHCVTLDFSCFFSILTSLVFTRLRSVCQITTAHIRNNLFLHMEHANLGCRCVLAFSMQQDRNLYTCVTRSDQNMVY